MHVVSATSVVPLLLLRPDKHRIRHLLRSVGRNRQVHNSRQASRHRDLHRVFPAFSPFACLPFLPPVDIVIATAGIALSGGGGVRAAIQGGRPPRRHPAADSEHRRPSHHPIPPEEALMVRGRIPRRRGALSFCFSRCGGSLRRRSKGTETGTGAETARRQGGSAAARRARRSAR